MGRLTTQEDNTRPTRLYTVRVNGDVAIGECTDIALVKRLGLHPSLHHAVVQITLDEFGQLFDCAVAGCELEIDCGLVVNRVASDSLIAFVGPFVPFVVSLRGADGWAEGRPRDELSGMRCCRRW